MALLGYDFRKGSDTPVWEWLSFFPTGPSYGGSASAYDGERFIYWAIQASVTTTTAAASALWRYDTFSDSWQHLTALTNGNQGMDVEYDKTRNVVMVIIGAATTAWQVFNLNSTAVTIANVSCAPWAITTMTPVLPAATAVGSSLTMPDDKDIASPIDTGIVAATGSSATTIVATDATATFGPGMVGLNLTFTSGALNNQTRTILTVSNKNTLVVSSAYSAAPASGDTFRVEVPFGTATSGSTTTLTDTAAAWAVNNYASSDVIITGGTGVGQRKRIASNTATVLTLAAAVTGNTRTGAFTTAPDATSTYKIVPSSDFLYYQVASTLHRLDLAQTTGAAWTALATTPAATGGGANTFYPGAYAPFQILSVRGSASSTVYTYGIGSNTWSTLSTTFGVETFTTGASSTMLHGKRKILIQKEGTTRLYAMDLLTGLLEPAGTMPYAVPVSYDGKRARFVLTKEGVSYVYILRSGGQEFFRVALEWM